MAEIALSKGLVAIVDEADVATLTRWPWHASINGGTTYARRWDAASGRSVYMHRQLLDPGPGLEVDHVNGNGLDNRRANLRLCTSAENKANRSRHRDARSPYRGVTFRPDKGRWRAEVRGQHLGYFATAEEAAAAYDEAVKAEYGPFARPNQGGPLTPGATYTVGENGPEVLVMASDVLIVPNDHLGGDE